jgi:hypothetical protein
MESKKNVRILPWGWPNHPRPNGVAGHPLVAQKGWLSHPYNFFKFFFVKKKQKTKKSIKI